MQHSDSVPTHGPHCLFLNTLLVLEQCLPQMVIVVQYRLTYMGTTLGTVIGGDGYPFW